MIHYRLFRLTAAVVIVVGVLFGALAQGVADLPPYKNSRLPAEQRVEDLLGRMTLEEKLDMLAGASWMETRGNARLGIPQIKMADGPLGVRTWAAPVTQTNAPSAAPRQVTATAFPAGIDLAATWNTELVQQVGRAIGQQVRALGRNMLLGPTLNIHRVPSGGRNFESYGEDPYLASRMAVAYIKGVQSEGVMATAKHFAANNQEDQRHTISAKIDERVLHEIYFPAFKAAVQEAGVWSVMSAYNKVNGLWCAENPYLLTEVLKTRWGFKGFVVSDWGGTYSTVESANAGLDIEMPKGEMIRQYVANRPRASATSSPVTIGGGFLERELLLPAASSGQIAQSVIDDKVRRLLRAMFSNGLFDRPDSPDRASSAGPVIDTPEQREVARKAATQGIVLLKNAGEVLPLGPSVRSVAVIGPNANIARTGGGGSSAVRSNYSVSPLEGIKQRAGSQVKVAYALGAAVEGEPGSEAPAAALIKEASNLAASSDVALLFVGYSYRSEGEGFDRKSLDLPAGQDDLIEAVVKANKNTIVILNTGGPVLMKRWIDQVPAVLSAWYLGQETGNALAAILFGDVSPSGKLPVTFIQEWKDSPAYGRYPGSNGVVAYDEGLYVGYRHFDKRSIEPLFTFGHGLSYTTFVYSGLKLTQRKVAPGQPVQVSLKVRNTGTREGAEVVQLYLRDVQSSVDRPVKELKAFGRVQLKPGETQSISLTLDKSAMAFYDPAKRDWAVEPGSFEVLVGSSSRDIRLKGSFELGR